VLEIVANFRSLKEIIDFANDQFRGLLSQENGQPGFTALQPMRLPLDERPAVACFDVTIGMTIRTTRARSWLIASGARKHVSSLTLLAA